MEIKMKPMGITQTNCYIITIDNKDLIIDPGIEAFSWIEKNVKNPVAILNTHGHFDHVWSNQEVKDAFKIPLYCPKEDSFMLLKCPLGQSVPPSIPDYQVVSNELLDIKNIKVKYRHFPGHTPGCSVIEIDDVWFSGDFLFQQSIGRWDFPFSCGTKMVQSLKKIQNTKKDFTIYPGHGPSTTLKKEQEFIHYWIAQIETSL